MLSINYLSNIVLSINQLPSKCVLSNTLGALLHCKPSPLYTPLEYWSTVQRTYCLTKLNCLPDIWLVYKGISCRSTVTLFQHVASSSFWPGARIRRRIGVFWSDPTIFPDIYDREEREINKDLVFGVRIRIRVFCFS